MTASSDLVAQVATALVNVGIYPAANQVGHSRDAYIKWAEAAIAAMPDAARVLALEADKAALVEALNDLASAMLILDTRSEASMAALGRGVVQASATLAKHGGDK